jgi:hypothetical protein
MDGTRVFQYQLTIKYGTKLIKGLKTTGLKIKPNYEEILLKEQAGNPEEELIDFDTEMSIAGDTWEKAAGEASTHEDFETLREASSTGVSVAFVYGRMSAGEKIVSGNAKLQDWSEDAGSEKKAGSWSGSLKAVKGTVIFGTYSS